MKIYNKIGFAFGINFLLIGITTFVMMLINKMSDGILIFIGSVAILIGLYFVSRAINKSTFKEDLLKIEDERNQEIKAKAREKTLLVFELILSISAFGSMIYGLITKGEFINSYIIAVAIIIILIEIIEYAFLSYFRKIN
ncbi:TPA: hypothetical protein HPU08_002880 [Listeria monocytogenes]|nr:hypothetical protein [Listeria monocytogenes]